MASSIDIVGGSDATEWPGEILSLDVLYTLLGIDSDTVTDAESLMAQISLKTAEGLVKRHLNYDPVYKQHTEYYPQTDLSFDGRSEIWDANESHAFLIRRPGESTHELQVKNLPVRATVAMDLRVDYDGKSGTTSGAFGSDTAWTEGTDFWPNYDMLDSAGDKVCNDGIIRAQGRWPQQAGSVKVVYYAGYTADEFAGDDNSIDASPIRLAVIEEASRYMHILHTKKKKSGVRGIAGWGVAGLSSENLGDYSYSADAASMKTLLSTASLSARSVLLLEPFLNYGGHLFL
jgi:hypothetical protein